MRPALRRAIAGVTVIAAATLGSMLLATPAHATTCYTVQVGPQGVTVCP